MTDRTCGRCNDQSKRPGEGIIAGCPVHSPPCPDCDYPPDSFACKIRHVHMNSGDAKAAQD